MALLYRCVFYLGILFLSFSLVPPVSAQVPDAPLDDAPLGTDGDGQNFATNNKSKKEPVLSVFNYRLYSIATLNYQPITDKTHPGVANGLFAEKSANAQLNFEISARPRLPGKMTFFVKTDAEANMSTLYPAASPFFEKDAGDWVRLNELFIDFSPIPFLSVLAGKYRRIFSPGLYQNPMDRHNPVSSLPGEPPQREGAWIGQLSLDANFGLENLSRFRLSVAYLPDFFQDKYGIPVNTRTVLTLNPKSPLGVSFVDETYSIDDMGGFVRLYLGLLKGDFNAIYYYTEKQNQFGFSYSRYFFNRLEWHGEVLFYEKPHSDFNVADSGVTFYTDALSGFRFDINDYFNISLEYLYRQENPRNYPGKLADQQRLWYGQLGADSNGSTLNPMRNYLILSFLGVNIKDVWDFAVNIIGNPFDNEYLFSLRVDYKTDRSAKISLAGLFKVADSTSFYGNFMPFDYQIRTEFYIALF